MHLRIKTSILFTVLAIFDLCACVPRLAADQTKNDISIVSNQSVWSVNNKQLLNDGDSNDKSELQTNDRWSSTAEQMTTNDIDHPNFLMTNFLPDGEVERRIQFDGITAKETLVSNFRGALSLWQLSYRDIFLQMIYTNEGEIMDCDFLTGTKYDQEFVQKFYEEIDKIRHFNEINGFDAKKYHIPKFRHHSRHNIPEIDLAMDSDDDLIGARNFTYQPLFGNDDIPTDLRRFMNFDTMKSECDAYHEKVMRMAGNLNSNTDDVVRNATEHLDRKKRALSDWLIAPNTKWCGRGQTADKYSQLGGASKADKCCRRHDHCKFNIYAMTTKWRLFNYRPFTISHCSCDMRRRRDLTNLLQVPGTKWCGKGYSAKKYAELGGRSKADRCCRQHDKSCPFWIMGFETKYGLFNWRINTLMHCKCDDRFRTCLKMADSADATMVGKLFFNIVQTKCFVLKPEKYCKSHSWWGACEVEGVRKRAFLRNNKKF